MERLDDISNVGNGILAIVTVDKGTEEDIDNADEGLCGQHSLPEIRVGAGVPFILQHAQGQRENQKIDGIEAGEAGEPELPLDQGGGAVGVVVGQDKAGDEEEETHKHVRVIDDGIQVMQMRRREVEQHNIQSQQSSESGESRKRGATFWEDGTVNAHSISRRAGRS